MDYILETSEKAIGPISSHQDINSRLSIIGSSLCIDFVRDYFSILNFKKLTWSVQDYGNLKASARSDWHKLIYELIDSEECIPLILSDIRSKDQILESYADLTDYKCGIISNRIIDLNRSEFAIQYDCYVGVQSHYHSEIEISEDNIVRLSDVRYNHDEAEVKLRNIDIAYIDLSVIRHSDNPGHKTSGPAGVTIEEACQLAKYIGASTQLKGVIIGGFDSNAAHSNITAEIIALLVFYIAEGYELRISESKLLNQSTKSYNTYTIVPDEIDQELVFVENKISGRWWLKLDNNKENDTIMIPCTKEDYDKACNNVITDKIAESFSLV